MVPSLSVLWIHSFKWAELKRTLPKAVISSKLLICEELFEIQETETVSPINVLVTHKGCAEGSCDRRVCRRGAAHRTGLRHVTQATQRRPASSVTGRSSAGKVGKV